jgi:hypothetical protein
MDIGTPKEKITDFLKDSNLMENIIRAVHETGIVGEDLPIKTIILTCCGKLVENKKTISTNLHLEDQSSTGKDHLVGRVKEVVFYNDWSVYNSPSPTAISYGQQKIKTKLQKQDGQKEPVIEMITVDNEITKNSIIYIKDGSNEMINGDDFKLLLEESNVNLRKTVKGEQIHLEWEKPIVIVTTADTNTENQLLRRLPSLHLNGSIDQTMAIIKYQLESDCDIIGKKEKRNEELIQTAKLSFYELKNIYVDLKNVKNMIEAKFPKNQDVIMRSLIPRLLDYIKFSTALHQYQRKELREGTYLADEKDVDIGYEVFNNMYKTEFADVSLLNSRQMKIRKKLIDNPDKSFTALEMISWKEIDGVSYSQVQQKDLPRIMQADPNIVVNSEKMPYRYSYISPITIKKDFDKELDSLF